MNNPTTYEEVRFEIHRRYWRDWASPPSWGYWHPCRPNLKYTYEEGNLEPVIKTMQGRIAKIQARRPENAGRVEYKIVKVRKIQIIEDIL
jgi:hypothetical protein